MTDNFLDMAPTEPVTVTVGEKQIPVPGIKASGVARLVMRFQGLAALVGAKQDASIVPKLLEMGDDVVAALIAAGTSYVNGEDKEVWAANLPLDKQLEFLAVIVERTMPGGVGPFVESLTKLIAALKMTDTIVSEPNAIRIRSKKSAQPSTT